MLFRNSIRYSILIFILFLLPSASLAWNPLKGDLSWDGKTKTPKTGYQTNKFDLKKRVEKGGWTVGWSSDISETDAINGMVAAGVSIYSSNPASFYYWAEQLVDRTTSSLSKSIKSQYRSKAEGLTKEVIRSAISGKSAKQIKKSFGNVEFKAGAIRYSGRNYIGSQTLSRTWGMKAYVAFRVSSSNKGYSSSKKRKGRSIRFTNKCYAPVDLAVRYKQTNGKWVNKYWYKFDPNEGFHLSSNGQRLRTNNRVVYYYAYSPKAGIKWKGDEIRKVGKRDLPMRKTRLHKSERGPYYYLNLSCKQ